MPLLTTMSEQGFLSKVAHVIDKHHMFVRHSRVLIGVSGGSDSLALLHLLYRLRRRWALSLWVAHLNHQLRGDAASADQEYVGAVAAHLKLPYITDAKNVRDLAREAGIGLEAVARGVRYKFFQEVAMRLSLSHIAVGHTASDQAETVLMRLLRGSGVEGLAGIPAVRGSIVRPLIGVYRWEVADYCRSQQLTPRADASNQDHRFLRNRIRLELLPQLARSYNPRVSEALCRTAELARIDNAFLEECGAQAFERVVQHYSVSQIRIDARAFSQLPQALKRRVIRQALKRLRGGLKGLQAYHIEAAAAMEPGAGTKALQLPGGCELRREYGSITIALRAPKSTTTTMSVAVPGKTALPEFGIWLHAEVVSPRRVQFSRDPTREYFDLHSVTSPVRVRSRRSGDLFFPLGMSRPKKLKEFFIDRKVPRRERDQVPILLSGERIMWVVGHQIDHRFRVTPTTTRVLRMEVGCNEASSRGDKKDP